MPGRIPMIIRENRPLPVYRQPVQHVTTLPNVSPGARQVPARVTMGGAMIGRVQFSRSGCSSCGK